MRNGIHHLHQRKRIHHLHQKWPHPDKKIKLLDDLVYVSAIIIPLTVFPQAYLIWTTHNVSGVSLWAWLLPAIFSLPLLMYAIVHKVKQYILMNVLWYIMYVAIITGLLVYK